MRVGPTLKQISDTYGDDVAIVFRHKPLPNHKQARPAAIAMQAAHRQGKAWEMHDLIFENFRTLTADSFAQFAGTLKLDVDKFNADMLDPSVAEEVSNDDKTATEVQANGTPTFFVNGRRVRGAKPLAAFTVIIDEELKKANALIEQGKAVADVYDLLAKHQKSN